MRSFTRTSASRRSRRTLGRAAEALLQAQYQQIRGAADLDAVFRAAIDAHADAVLVLRSPTTSSYGKQIADLAVQNRLPSLYPLSAPVRNGGLLSYGVHLTDLFRRAATYVDKILKGAKPADLPVEQSTKFELVINLKPVKALGLTIPPSVLARAAQVIDQ